MGERWRNTANLFGDKGYMLTYNVNKVMLDHNAAIPAEVTDEDLGRIVRLTQALFHESGRLSVKVGARLHRPARIADIAKLLGRSDRHTRDWLTQMEAHKMLTYAVVDGEEGYYLNPIYLRMGKWLSLVNWSVHIKELGGMVPEWAQREFMEQGKATGRNSLTVERGERNV